MAVTQRQIMRAQAKENGAMTDKLVY